MAEYCETKREILAIRAVSEMIVYSNGYCLLNLTNAQRYMALTGADGPEAVGVIRRE